MKIQQREGRKEALNSYPLLLGRSYCPESEHIAQKHHYWSQVLTYLQLFPEPQNAEGLRVISFPI